MDKLMIEDVEKYLKCVATQDDFFPLRLARQLLDTMRENGRLREALGGLLEVREEYGNFKFSMMKRLAAEEHAKAVLHPNKESDITRCTSCGDVISMCCCT